MERLFDRNMFIMLLSIMVGVIIITYFVADIMKNAELEKQAEEHKIEIKDLQTKNLNLLSNILSSIGDLIRSSNYRVTGNYYFDLASIWYTTALSETNISELEKYKTLIYDSCDDAMYNYNLSNVNYVVAKTKFQFTLTESTEEFKDLIGLYVNLTDKGAELANLRANASMYLRYLAENVTIKNNTVAFMTNITEVQELFNITVGLYGVLETEYSMIEEEIEKEYNIIGFSEEREIEI